MSCFDFSKVPLSAPVTYAEHFIRLIRGPSPIEAIGVLATAHKEVIERYPDCFFFHFPDDSSIGYRTSDHEVWTL